MSFTFISPTIAAEAAGTVVEGAAGGTALLGVVLILLGEWFYICLFSLFCVLLFASRCMVTISTERQCHLAEQFSLLFRSIYFALHLTFVPLWPTSHTGALVQSLQYVFEEKVMSAGEDDPNMAPTPPLLLVSAFVGLIE